MKGAQEASGAVGGHQGEGGMCGDFADLALEPSLVLEPSLTLETLSAQMTASSADVNSPGYRERKNVQFVGLLFRRVVTCALAVHTNIPVHTNTHTFTHSHLHTQTHTNTGHSGRGPTGHAYG